MAQSDQEKTVLVVDDDEYVRRTLQGIIKTIPGAKCVMAPDAQAGMKILEEHAGRIALVISDLNMPGETGLDVVRWLRSGGNRVPVIIYSGSLIAGEETKAMGMGVDLVMSKPGDVPTLRRVIMRFLGIAQ